MSREQRARRRIVLAVTIVTLLASVSCGAAVAGASVRTYSYSGGEQVFLVPTGVFSVQVLAVGGQGASTSKPGGAAGQASGELSVTPGEKLYVEVGGAGGAGTGGFNGGGAATAGAGGGGGASDVRTAPRSEGLFPDDRLLVAAGGGGAGATGNVSAGAGGAAGQNGEQIAVDEGGRAGGSEAGGAPGGGGCETGLAGVLASGGRGGSFRYPGGGGGGGYYGGGGGAAGCYSGGGGGGGGSSLVPAGGSAGIAPTGTEPLVQITYTKPANPTVETGTATDITRESATVSATVNPEGAEVSSCYFEYGTSPAFGSSTPCQSSPGSGTAPVAVSASLTGLQLNSPYYYRIVATNREGTSYGEDGTFTTLPNPPAIGNLGATSISLSTATLTASVNPEGAETNCNFEYGPTGNPTESTAPCTPSPGHGSTPTTVTANLTNLKADTTYSYTITAQNNGGTSHTTTPSFTTLPYSPATTTLPASSVGQQSAVLNATVDPQGVVAEECLFEYGQSEAYGSSVSCSTLPGPAQAAVTAHLSGLQAGGTYHYRIVAASKGGRTAGLDGTFTTALPALPEVGRCVKAGPPLATYKDPRCTAAATSAKTQRYAWLPWPAAQNNFVGVVGAATVTGTSRAGFECKAGSWTGRFSNSQTLAATLVLTGCHGVGALAGECSSAGAAAGELVSAPLAGTLGALPGNAKSAGLSLQPAAGNALFELGCNGQSALLEGGVVASVSKVDAMSSSLTLSFKGKNGEPKLTSLAGGQPHTPVLVHGGPAEPAALSATLRGAYEEPLEIKALP